MRVTQFGLLGRERSRFSGVSGLAWRDETAFPFGNRRVGGRLGYGRAGGCRPSSPAPGPPPIIGSRQNREARPIPQGRRPDCGWRDRQGALRPQRNGRTPPRFADQDDDALFAVRGIEGRQDHHADTDAGVIPRGTATADQALAAAGQHHHGGHGDPRHRHPLGQRCRCGDRRGAWAEPNFISPR